MQVAVVCPDMNIALEVVGGLRSNVDARATVLCQGGSLLEVIFDNGDEIIWVNTLKKAKGRKFDCAFIYDADPLTYTYQIVVEEVMDRCDGNYMFFETVEGLFKKLRDRKET